jgi:acyl carrier protein
MMLVRPAVQMLVEAAIRQASSKSIELSPDTVLVYVGLDSLDTINIEISIETNTDDTIKFRDETRIDVKDTVSQVVDKAMKSQ